ncbi:MAG: phosphorylase [Methylococcaceae bacterium]|nr:phosphorylase [Methylococcaceae bacterium]
MLTGIVIALPEELATLTSKRLKKGCIETLNDKILIICSGAGENNARLASELLVDNGVKRLISWGCAAALDSALQSGDLVLAESCIDAQQVGIEFDNKGWVSHVQSSINRQIPIYVGKLAESKHIVETTEDKTELGKATGAIALDMESTAIAKVASLNGIPFMTIRVIADTLKMNLPKSVSYALNEQGEVVLKKLLLFLFLHPSELPGLIKLGFAFNAAKKTLKCIARDIQLIIHDGSSDISVS